jgi:rod shape-determining protein MreC
MGALIFRTREAAVAEGDFSLMSQGLLKLTYLPEDTVLLNGDIIETSGVGGVYPKELRIGTVTKV